MAAPAGMLVLQGGRQPEPRESRDGALDKLERDRAREIQVVGVGISAFTATPPCGQRGKACQPGLEAPVNKRRNWRLDEPQTRDVT